MQRSSALVSSFLLFALGSGCGDDASSAAGQGGAGAASTGGSAATGAGMSGPDTTPPSVVLSFPPAGAIAAESITVRGTAADESAIAELTVNGIAADSDDGFATWRAVVPLAEGANAILVASVDEAGNASEEAAAVTIERTEGVSSVGTGPVLVAAYGATVRRDATRAYFVDDVPDGIIEVDLSTGVRTEIVSDDPADAGTEMDIVRPLAIAAAEASSRFVMVDSGAEALLGADGADGTHWVIASDTVGSGPLGYPAKVHFDPAGDAAFVLDTGLAALLRVDLASGAREAITTATFDEPNGLGVSLDGAFVYTAEPYDPSLLEVDVTTGAVRVVSSDSVGGGAPLGRPTQVGIDPERGEAIVWDADAQALLGIDVATGDRRVIADPSTGQGHALSAIDDLATTHGWALVLDADNLALVAVDTLSGDRVIVAR